MTRVAGRALHGTQCVRDAVAVNLLLSSLITEINNVLIPKASENKGM